MMSESLDRIHDVIISCVVSCSITNEQHNVSDRVVEAAHGYYIACSVSSNLSVF